MKPVALALIALLVAVCALGVALLDGPGPNHVAEAAPLVAPDGVLVRRIETVETELTRLRDEIDRLQPSLVETRSAGASEGDGGVDLNARIAALERRLDELRDARKDATAGGKAERVEADSARKTFRMADDQARRDVLEGLLQVARDASASDGERLRALRYLRGKQLPNGTDARIPVLPEMIRIGETSESAEHRADVWRQLSGVTERSLLTPLLNALQHDPSANTRAEAAETLAKFLPDPMVRSALQFAADNDPSPQVRAQALESLATLGP